MKSWVAAAVGVGLVLAGTRAGAVELDWSGRLQTDVRFRVQQRRIGQWYNRTDLARGVSRNENIAKLRLEATAGRFFGVAEVDFVWVGMMRDVVSFTDVSLREEVDPFRLEAHALYVEASDLLIEGLDLRVGQQKIQWGKGDQFNPTNTLNADDVEDPVLFGEQIANTMIRLDYSPAPLWTLSAVLVPIFKPAQLPGTAAIGLGQVDRLPFVEDRLRQRIHAEQMFSEQINRPTIVSVARIELPQPALDNMQLALRLGGVIGEQDLALSYYVGREDFPQPFLNYTYLDDTSRCNPGDPADCISGLIKTEVSLGYRRMQVLGFNAAGQVDLLGWLSSKIKSIGYRVEVGVFFPEEASITLLQEEILGQAAGEYAYDLGGARPRTVTDTPFAKWVIGLDYTFGRYVYANLQWVHGFVDEFGAGDFISEGWAVRKGSATTGPELGPCALSDTQRGERCAVELLTPRLGDYFVATFDIKLLGEKLLWRIAWFMALNGIFEERWDDGAQRRVRKHHSLFSSDGFSAVLYPELTYNFGQGLELSAGAIVTLGKMHTKFGDPSAGGSQVWTRARFAF